MNDSTQQELNMGNESQQESLDELLNLVNVQQAQIERLQQLLTEAQDRNDRWQTTHSQLTSDYEQMRTAHEQMRKLLDEQTQRLNAASGRLNLLTESSRHSRSLTALTSNLLFSTQNRGA